MATRPDGPAQLRVQRLDRVRCVDDPPDAFGKGEERNHEVPIAPPTLGDSGILAAPWTLCEGVERGLACLSISRAIDGPQCLRHTLAILPGGKIHGMADQVNDAGLNDCLRKNRIDSFWKALQAIDKPRAARTWRLPSVRSRCQESPWCRPAGCRARCKSLCCGR